MSKTESPAPSVAEMVPGEGELRAIFKTSMGNITVKLLEEKAPRTVANFVALAMGKVAWTDPNTGKPTEKPLYSGTIFHRVIPDFMIQGGDPTGTGRGGPGWRFADEIDPKTNRHDRPGVLSMANAGPNTNGSQFFLCEVATPHLDRGHTVFGHTIDGVHLIPEITRVPRDGSDRPRTPVTLNEITIERV